MSAQALATALGPPLMLHSTSSSGSVEEIDHAQPIAVLKYLLQIWPQPATSGVVSGNVPCLQKINFVVDGKVIILIHFSLDRHTSARQRAANRNAWKQSQCIASGQIATAGGNQQYSLIGRSNSAFSHGQQSSVSISSGSVSSIASSLTAGGSNGKSVKFLELKI